MLAWATGLSDKRPMSAVSSFRAGLVWSLGAALFFYAFFQRVAPGVMVNELMRDFGVTATLLGNLSAFYFYAYAGIQLPVGVLADRFGPRRLLTAAAAVAGAGSLLFALSEQLTVAYLGRLMVGFGVGFGFVCSLKLAANWFPPQRFALLSGLTMMAGMAGGVGGQAPLAMGVETIGWRGTMIGAAVFALVLAALAWTIVRDRPEGDESRPENGESLRVAVAGLGLVMKQPQSWLLGLIGFTMVSSLLAFGSLWGVPYMMKVYGLSRAAAAGSMSLMLIGWAIGAPAIGWLSDHLMKRKAPLLISTLVALASIAGLIYVPGLPLAAVEVLLLVNGIASGGMVLCFATAREVNRSEAAGATAGLINMWVILSGALFQPVIGWLLDANWDGVLEAGVRVYAEDAYERALLTLVVCTAAAVVMATMVRETHCRPRADA